MNGVRPYKAPTPGHPTNAVLEPSQPTSMSSPEIPRASPAPPTVRESPTLREATAEGVPKAPAAPPIVQKVLPLQEVATPAALKLTLFQGATTTNLATIARENSLRASLLRNKRGNTLWTLSLALLIAQSSRTQGITTKLVPPDFPINYDYGVGILAGGVGFSDPENKQDQENWSFLRRCTGTHPHEACLYVWILLLACVPELHCPAAKANRIRGQRKSPGLLAAELLELKRNEAREYVKRFVDVEPFFRWFKTVGAAVEEMDAVITSDVAMRLAGVVDVEGGSYPGGKDSAEKALVGIAAEHIEFAVRLWEVIDI